MKLLVLLILCQIWQLHAQITDEFMFTETVTESRDFATSTTDTVAATKTVYLIPKKQRPWWYKESEVAPGYTRQMDTVTETETEFIHVTVTRPCQQTAAPMTVTIPITTTVTRTRLHWKSIPVGIKYYETLTETTTARPLIAELLPKIDITGVVNSQYTSNFHTTYHPQQQAIRMSFEGGHGQLAGHYVSGFDRITSTKTVVSTITPNGDWNEYKAATLNACDLCRQRCTNLNSNCCVEECMGQSRVMHMPCPVPPIIPEPIHCDNS